MLDEWKDEIKDGEFSETGKLENSAGVISEVKGFFENEFQNVNEDGIIFTDKNNRFISIDIEGFEFIDDTYFFTFKDIKYRVKEAHLEGDYQIIYLYANNN